MQQRGVRFHGLDSVENRGQQLVFHVDQGGGSGGDLGVAGDHGGHLLADEADAVLREDVPVLHVEAEAIGEVLAGDHADHAGQRGGGAGVDIEDASVRVRAFHDAGVEQAGTEFQVVGESRGAGDFFPAVDALGGMADGFGVDRRLNQGFEFSHGWLRWRLRWPRLR